MKIGTVNTREASRTHACDTEVLDNTLGKVRPGMATARYMTYSGRGRSPEFGAWDVNLGGMEREMQRHGQEGWTIVRLILDLRRGPSRQGLSVGSTSDGEVRVSRQVSVLNLIGEALTMGARALGGTGGKVHVADAGPSRHVELKFGRLLSYEEFCPQGG